MKLEDFRNALYDFYKRNDKTENPRQLIVHAGEGFHRMVDDKIQELVALDTLKLLKSMKILTSKEVKRIKSMITSPDKENLTIAKGIMDFKLKEYGDTGTL